MAYVILLQHGGSVVQHEATQNGKWFDKIVDNIAVSGSDHFIPKHVAVELCSVSEQRLKVCLTTSYGSIIHHQEYMPILYIHN